MPFVSLEKKWQNMGFVVSFFQSKLLELRESERKITTCKAEKLYTLFVLTYWFTKFCFSKITSMQTIFFEEYFSWVVAFVLFSGVVDTALAFLEKLQILFKNSSSVTLVPSSSLSNDLQCVCSWNVLRKADYYRELFGFRISPKNIRLD